MDLDDIRHFREIDPDGMIDHINAMPEHIEDTWARAQALRLPDALAQVDKIVICGMGGSAIGGELMAAAVADECPIPILINRGYDLPACAKGKSTLVIACSHSGNTEETLAAFASAGQRGAQRLAVTRGGTLLEKAGEAGVTAWTFDYASQPRASLGFSLSLLLALASRLGLAHNLSHHVAEAVDVLREQTPHLRPETATEENPAKRLAGRLVERIPVIYGAAIMAPVAHRWKTQFNENSKTWAHFEVMPELNHNSVVGISFPEGLTRKVATVMLRSDYDSPRIAQRFDETRRLLEDSAGITVEEVRGQGRGRLAQMLSALRHGDYVSYYLAMAADVDPTPVQPIVMLKQKLGVFAG